MAPKSPSFPPLRSRDDVETELVLVAACYATRDRLKAEADERLRAVAAEGAAVTEPVNAEIEAREKRIEAWAFGHKAEFGEARSLDLVHGRIGWRASTSIRFVAKVADILAELKRRAVEFRRRRFPNAVAVKESVSREALEQYPDETLVELGARRQRGDHFYIELITALPDKAS